MYQEFYGFTRLPFERDIPPDDLFASQPQQEMAARLTYLLRQRGLGLVTGDIGAGKSTAMRAFTARLDPNRYFVVYLSNPTVGVSGLYRDILTALHREPPFSRPRQVAAIRAAFAELAESKRRFPLLVIDEAHLLPSHAFEQFRLLIADQTCPEFTEGWTANLWLPSFWSASPTCATCCAYRPTRPSTSASLFVTTCRPLTCKTVSLTSSIICS